MALPSLRAERRVLAAVGAALILGGLSACAPLPPDARIRAREEHAKQTETPPAIPAPAHPEVLSWPVGNMAALDGVAVELRREDSTVAIFPLPTFKAFHQAAQRILSVANQDLPELMPEVRVVEGWSANAFAVSRPEHPLITANFGMLALLGDDEAMWATVFGHELAHLKLKHQEQRTERDEWGHRASGVLSVMLGFVGVPLAPLLTDTAASMVTRGYSREDEMEADALALVYLRRAGYDPVAALRFHQRLAMHTGNQPKGLMSTHPAGTERIEAIRNLLETSASR